MATKFNLDSLHEIPPLSIISQEILKFRDSDTGSLQELADIIDKDPSLSAQIFKWASSAYYNPRGQIKTTFDAIFRVLGMDLVTSIALGLSMTNSIGLNKQEEYLYLYKSLWMAISSSTIAKSSPKIDTGIAYLSGLLSNYGYILLTYLDKSNTRKLDTFLLENPTATLSQITTFEVNEFGISRNELAGRVFKLWGLPEEVIHSVINQDSYSYDSELSIYNLLLYIAKQNLILVDILDGAKEEIPAGAYSKLGLDKDQTEDFFSDNLDTMESFMKDLISVFNT